MPKYKGGKNNGKKEKSWKTKEKEIKLD